MNLFPFFTDISGKTFLIVGGGSVAKEKADSIGRFGEQIVIVAKETDISETANIKVIKREFRPEDIDMADYVIGATGDRNLNKTIAALCEERSVPVNIVDDAALCTFVMPSIVKRGKLVLAISTNGASPAYAMRLRRQMEDELPDSIEDILGRMEHIRESVMAHIPDQKDRKIFFKKLLGELIETDNCLSDEEIAERIENYEG